MRTQRVFRHVFIAVVVVAIAVLPNIAWAAPGDPDTSFDGDGFQTLDFPGAASDQAEAILVQTNGRIVLAGESGPGGANNFALARLMANGLPDPSFDGDGFQSFDFRGAGGPDEAWDLVQQPDGKIVAVGWAEEVSGSASRFAVARFRSNGSLDPSFSGDGKLLVKFAGLDSAFAGTVVLQDDGKILVGGEAGDDGSSEWYFAVVRLTSDGGIDHSYGGGDGRVVTNIAADDDGIIDMVLQPDGKLLTAGWSENNAADNLRSAFVRYRSSGALDRTFSGDGKKVLDVSDANDEAQGVEVRSDGKIVAAVGVGDTPMALVRLTPRGKADPTFSGNGQLIVDPYPAGLGDSDLDLAGKKLVVTSDTFDLKIFVARYKPNGSPDTTFGGGDGQVVTAFPGASQSRAFSSAIQGNGRILVAGMADMGTQDFGVARFLP